MTRARDTQRSKLYAAESVVHGDKFESVADMQRYVDKLVGRAWFKRRWPNVTSIEVRDGRGRSRAGAYSRGGYITMPRWSRYEEVVLHEVAHIVTDYQHGTNLAAHGWQFAHNLIELVHYHMGKDEADKMKASFRKAKVRFSEPKKRAPLSDEQRSANIERLAKARASREANKPVRAIAWQETVLERGYGNPRRIFFDWSRLVLVGAKTKKAAAEMVDIPYAEFARDSKWVEKGCSQDVAAAAEGIAEGAIIRLHLPTGNHGRWEIEEAVSHPSAKVRS